MKQFSLFYKFVWTNVHNDRLPFTVISFFCRFSIFFFFSISRSEDGIFGSRGYSYIQNRINNVCFSCIYVYACTCPCVHVSVCTIIVSALCTKKSSCKRSRLLKCHLLFNFSFFFFFLYKPDTTTGALLNISHCRVEVKIKVSRVASYVI